MRLIKRYKSCLVLLLTLSLASTTFASPGKYVRLKEGEKIPWQGWCFDGQAVAELVASKELAEQKCELHTMQELDQQKARFDLQIGELLASMEYEVQTRDVTIQALQEENLKIEQALIHDTKYGWIAPTALGFIAGALTIFLVTL